MSNWYLINHNPKAVQGIIFRIRALGAEDVYSPANLKITKRLDCNGVRTSETQLFPGYLFVKLNPEVLHTSIVLQVSGVGVRGAMEQGSQLSCLGHQQWSVHRWGFGSAAMFEFASTAARTGGVASNFRSFSA
ncbi:transcription termination/antitermination NusG family protein [Pseudomonas ficuserectae]|uniref:transcription termination/antitermination NusG family protein n=1 Tax=Pseudomonas ficuserectae TaxID=53410 RepID=UPI00211C3D71|nr:transcription termination/antitermination NusG family protein [Pseudomonas ficuserectae]